MSRRNGNWLAPSINQRTATAVAVRAALSGYRSIKPKPDQAGRKERERGPGGPKPVGEDVRIQHRRPDYDRSHTR
jgi:hypothetical protein